MTVNKSTILIMSLNPVGDTEWLSIPMGGKLDPKWEGGWLLGSKPYTISDR